LFLPASSRLAVAGVFLALNCCAALTGTTREQLSLDQGWPKPGRLMSLTRLLTALRKSLVKACDGRAVGG
jgi:hypothetical protein